MKRPLKTSGLTQSRDHRVDATQSILAADAREQMRFDREHGHNRQVPQLIETQRFVIGVARRTRSRWRRKTASTLNRSGIYHYEITLANL
jgi:hypothetical protein